MGKIADYIATQMGQDGGQVQMQAPVQGQGQGQGAPEVDPLIDTVARKMAVFEGSPEEKYSIFVQLFPMLMNAMAERAAQGQQGGGPVPGVEGYEVSGNVGGLR